MKTSLNLWRSWKSDKSEETLPDENSLKLEVYCQMTQAGFRLYGDGRRNGGNDAVREQVYLFHQQNKRKILL